MNTLLKQAKERYPKGTMFLSATGNLKKPMLVNQLIVSENYTDTISNENGGIICMPDEDSGDIIWAEKVLKDEK